MPTQTSRNTRKAKRANEKRREKHLRLSYCWTESIYQHNFLMQGLQCAICGSEDPKHSKYPFVVDHDHNTGHPRGLLCHQCNVALGMFEDNIDTLKNAIAYLTEHSEAPQRSAQ